MNLDLSLFSSNVLDYWPELEKFLPEAWERDEIRSAYNFAFKYHKNQKRETGEPYISHLVWIAKVTAQLGVGKEAIVAALLHDCIEETEATLEQIASTFGDEVALLVGGLTEVKKNTQGIKIQKNKIEVFRNFLFSSVNDVRVLIIRLIDKLHNGLTIEHLGYESQVNYAERVFGIYGPIAEYVGLHYFKRKLEDISFKILYPKEAEHLEKILKENAKNEIKALAEVREELERMLEINNIHDYEIHGRIKSLYSTYLKSRNKGEDDVKDRVGVRVIAQDVSDCYTILGLLHARYEYLADEFDDYISSPKPNGYRSIQTTLNWKNKLTVEVQIRTKQMHEFNEFGPASHIAYKYSKGTGQGYEWVRDLIKWQRNDKNVNNYRINVLTKFVYVFTPKGDTIQLPAGSTALDFAYRIHTDIGDHCAGVKINGKMSKIDSVLKSGDLIFIMTNKRKNVSKEWLHFVKTSWAKEHIRKMTLEKQ